MKITLPIYYEGEETDSIKLGISEAPRIIKYQIFYEITSILMHSNAKETLIYSGGEVYVCALELRVVERLIDESKNKFILQKLYN